MQKYIAAILATIVTSSAFSDTPPTYKIEFSVQIDKGDAVHMSAEVPAGTSKTLQATPHLSLEIEVPSSITSKTPLTVKLFDDSVGQKLIRHEYQILAPPRDTLTYNYRVCKESTIFSKNSPAKLANCDK